MTVASNLTDISLCESLTDWAVSGGPTIGLKDFAGDGINPIEGTYCIGGDVDIETGVYLYDVYTANGNVAQNYTGRHLHIWAMCITANFLDTRINGGIRLVIEDSSGNQGYWYVAGSDTYFGGWTKFVIDCDSTPTTNNGTNPTISATHHVGIAFKATQKSSLGENCLLDLVQYGNTADAVLIVTGGTSGTPLTWDDILTQDQALSKPTGIIQKFGGIFYLQAPFLFGDTGTGDTYFADNQDIVWLDTLASISYYDITLTGNSTGSTSFVLGSVTGTSDARFGYSGGSIKSEGVHAWTFDAETNTVNIDECFLYGVTIRDAGDLLFDDNTNTQIIISCTFDDCGQVQPNEALILNSFFLNNTDSLGAVEMLNNDDDNIRYCTWKNCTNAIYLPSGQTLTRDFVGLDIDATYDLYNDAGSTVTINADANTTVDETENPAGDPISVVNTKTLTINVVDESDTGIDSAQVRIENAITRTLVSSGTTTSGVYTDSSYNYTGDENVIVKIRKSSTGTTRYVSASQPATITTNGLNVKIVMKTDSIASS